MAKTPERAIRANEKWRKNLKGRGLTLIRVAVPIAIASQIKSFIKVYMQANGYEVDNRKRKQGDGE